MQLAALKGYLGDRFDKVAASLTADDGYRIVVEATGAAARPRYDQAILRYEKIIDQGGIQNAKLSYNLANAYLLKEDLGRAILNYRRAAKLDRSDLNLQKNLSFARSRRLDRVETSTERRVLQTLFFWHYDFSLPTKFLLASVFFAILCVASMLIVWFGRRSAASAAAVLATVRHWRSPPRLPALRRSRSSGWNCRVSKMPLRIRSRWRTGN